MSTKKFLSAAALAFLMTTGIASAQSTTTPGTPNTGVGDSATANLILLGTTLAVALAGFAYLSRRKMLE